MSSIKELSLNILDVVGNSIKAGATLIEILLLQEKNKLSIQINDNGCGMSKQVIEKVTNPFYTTRTTRSVGLGVPFFKEAAEQTGGSFDIKSVEKSIDSKNCGTKVTANFFTDHIDFTPIGDIVSTVITLIQGSPDIDFYFLHKIDEKEVSINTREIRSVLGDVPLNSFEVINFIRSSLEEEYKTINKSL